MGLDNIEQRKDPSEEIMELLDSKYAELEQVGTDNEPDTERVMEDIDHLRNQWRAQNALEAHQIALNESVRLGDDDRIEQNQEIVDQLRRRIKLYHEVGMLKTGIRAAELQINAEGSQELIENNRQMIEEREKELEEMDSHEDWWKAAA